MLIFHFNIYSMNNISIWHLYTIRIFIYYIPSFLWHFTSFKICKYVLMKIANIIII